MKTLQAPLALLAIALFAIPVQAQLSGLESISSDELKTHMLFLASDELEGRDTGEPGLQVAARYLAVQAEALGLQPLDADMDYLQPFLITDKA